MVPLKSAFAELDKGGPSKFVCNAANSPVFLRYLIFENNLSAESAVDRTSICCQIWGGQNEDGNVRLKAGPSERPEEHNGRFVLIE
ncbi:unnamed protein product [Toxocara canis]|uniref:Alpha-galactosidase n=1 Tax=Toxocara canis TaxID=6265 RepID=A0A183UH98_TOXCA|nr:unnamed protein product [Toxocara canis]